MAMLFGDNSSSSTDNTTIMSRPVFECLNSDLRCVDIEKKTSSFMPKDLPTPEQYLKDCVDVKRDPDTGEFDVMVTTREDAVLYYTRMLEYDKLSQILLKNPDTLQKEYEEYCERYNIHKTNKDTYHAQIDGYIKQMQEYSACFTEQRYYNYYNSCYNNTPDEPLMSYEDWCEHVHACFATEVANSMANITRCKDRYNNYYSSIEKKNNEIKAFNAKYGTSFDTIPLKEWDPASVGG